MGEKPPREQAAAFVTRVSRPDPPKPSRKGREPSTTPAVVSGIRVIGFLLLVVSVVFLCLSWYAVPGTAASATFWTCAVIAVITAVPLLVLAAILKALFDRLPPPNRAQ